MKIEKQELNYILTIMGMVLAIFSIPNIQLQILSSMFLVLTINLYILTKEFKSYNLRINLIEEKLRWKNK